MRIVEIRTQPETPGLREAWDALLARSAAGTGSIFLTWDWFQAWWSSYAEPDFQLRLLLVYDEAGGLCAIAPLREETVGRHGQSRRVIRFAVDCSNDSEYLDFIVAADHEGGARAALAGWLEAECRRGAVHLLNELPAASPTLGVLRSLGEAARLAVVEAERNLIVPTLRKVHWNRRKAAPLLGISYKTLLNKIKEHALLAQKLAPQDHHFGASAVESIGLHWLSQLD